ncbi:MAG: secondary thiamine-phosphate synthase enzyme YjbQ [Planctomycetota bacterium]
MIENTTILFNTEAEMDVVDITKDVADVLAESAISDGVATVFCPGSTGALTTMEYEPGLVRDVKELFEKLVPRDHYYHHEERWHDNNGHSHVRASLIGPSVTVPFRDRRLMLGTWQQIVFYDFDVRARERELIVQVTGEEEKVGKQQEE